MLVLAMTVDTVHPRAYGEHVFLVAAAGNTDGSSPCLRGTLYYRPCYSPHGRFIPVLTGNTSAVGIWRRAFPVHPRAYGEHDHAAH